MYDLINRNKNMFSDDISNNSSALDKICSESKFLVIGAAGSIGQAVTKEIFKRSPKTLHAIDISENNMVELVRDLRSSIGYISGEFKTYAIDCGSLEFESLLKQNNYDYVFNLSALKHVRSEKDPFTLMRLIEVNILNTIKTIKLAKLSGVKKYFCVSTDKAANPVNMMGASKRIMEMFLMKESELIDISTARFANVAFSDGSLLHGFNQRINKMQPISAPNDIRRYFVTPQESGELCLMSCLLGENRDIFFPKLNEELDLITFSEIAIKYLNKIGYEAYICASEEEARTNIEELIKEKKWPCYFFKTDTTGEKDFEEFYTDEEELDMNTYKNVGVIKNLPSFSEKKLIYFLDEIYSIKHKGIWHKSEIVDLFNITLPNFNHIDKEKDLDQKM